MPLETIIEQKKYGLMPVHKLHFKDTTIHQLINKQVEQ